MSREQETPVVDKDTVAAPEPGFGEQLRGTREACGLSLDEVAKRTRIRPAFLRAYEEEDLECLPSPPYAIGFLRQYALLLELDADRLVEDFRRAGSAEPNRSKPQRMEDVADEAAEVKPFFPAWSRWLALALLLAGLAVLLSFALTHATPFAVDGRYFDPGHAFLLS